MRFSILFASPALVSVLAASSAAQDWLDAPRVILPGDPALIRKVADLDGDGDADLLVVEEDENWSVLNFHALLQDAGTFQAGPETILPPEANVYPGQALFEVGDLTHDGLPDVVMEVRNYNTGVHGVSLYPNTGGGSFGAPIFVATDSFVWHGKMADADGDGGLELGLLMFVSVNLEVVGWWRWNGTTLKPRPHTMVDLYSDSLAAIDLTGDGRSELVVGRDSVPEVDLLTTLPGGQPELTATLSFGSGLGSTRSLNPGDVDGDGDVDLVVTWATSGELHVAVAANEGGALVPGPEQVFVVGDEMVLARTLADWDLDGDLDLLCWSKYLLLLENRGGRFEFADALWVQPYDDGTALGLRYGGVGDLTADGRPDFAAAHFVYAGDGELGDAGPVPASYNRNPVQQDFDGDGDLDVLDFYFSDSRVHENDGAGRFTPRTLDTHLVAAPGQLFREAHPPVDLDGDGHGDMLRVLVEDEYPTFPVVETRFLHGSAIGTFADTHAAGAPGVGITPAVWENAAADLDGDGDADVLTNGGYWENDGTGFFASHHAAWTGSPRATADVDGDGDLDVLVVTGSGGLALARNQGSGFTLEPITALVLRSGPFVGDMDGDGDLDLAAGTLAGGPAVLLFQNTGGSFAAPLRLDHGEQPVSTLALEDFDGDGKQDVLAMPHDFESTEWFLWRQLPSGWQFEAPVRFIGAHALTSGDFDADGDRDVFGGRIVRTRRFDGPADGRIRQHGAGWPGPEPLAPLLGASGPLRPGSSTAVLRVSRARGGALGQLILSGRALMRGPAGWTRGVGPFSPTMIFALGGTPGASGEGTFEISLGPATLALQGQRIWMQALIADPGQPRRFSSTTNALELTFGQ